MSTRRRLSPGKFIKKKKKNLSYTVCVENILILRILRSWRNSMYRNRPIASYRRASTMLQQTLRPFHHAEAHANLQRSQMH